MATFDTDMSSCPCCVHPFECYSCSAGIRASSDNLYLTFTGCPDSHMTNGIPYTLTFFPTGDGTGQAWDFCDDVDGDYPIRCFSYRCGPYSIGPFFAGLDIYLATGDRYNYVGLGASSSDGTCSPFSCNLPTWTLSINFGGYNPVSGMSAVVTQ